MAMTSVRFAVLTDTHYALQPAPIPARKAEFGMLLLHRALAYLQIRRDVDIILLTGDLLNDPADRQLLQELPPILKRTAFCPVLSIPGNHDPDPETFYGILEQHDCLDIKGVRFIPFCDEERPGYNASRSPAELERAERLCREWNGPKVFLQHCPLFPPGAANNHYGYDNAETIIRQMHAHGVAIAVSGHQHSGLSPYSDGQATFMCAPALCEAPFSFIIGEIHADGRVSQEVVPLRLPDAGGLIDRHTHTPLAYCNENMDFTAESRLLDLFNLGGAAITEHAFHLHYTRDAYKSWYDESLGAPSPHACNRTEAYLRLLDQATAADPRYIRGCEFDINRHGELIANPALEAAVSLRLGAIHRLHDPASDAAGDHFLALVQRLIRDYGIHVLVHPFRIFSWDGVGHKPAHLFAPLVALLREHGVAAEINFHHNRPDPDFCRLCLDAGVKFSLGSDSHNLYEVGFLNPHLDFLRAIGYDGDLRDILL